MDKQELLTFIKHEVKKEVDKQLGKRRKGYIVKPRTPRELQSKREREYYEKYIQKKTGKTTQQ